MSNVSIRIFFYVVASLTIFMGYLHLNENSKWGIGDWLINYSGGFVRRGITGEVVLFFSNVFNLSNLGAIVVTIQVVLYFLLFYITYNIIKNESCRRSYIYIFYSPFIFLFPLNNYTSFGRKEILYIVLISSLVYLAKHVTVEKFKIIFILSFMIYPLFILSHEALILTVPLLWILYLFHVGISRNNILMLFLISIPSLVVFLVSIFYRGDESQVIAIYNSLKGYPIHSDGAIDALSKDTKYYMDKRFNILFYLYYAPLTLLSIVAFIPIRERVYHILSSRICRFLFLTSIIGFVVLSTVAIDWGRWMYIIFISMFFLSFLSDKRTMNIPKSREVNISVWAYATLWMLPYVPYVKTINIFFLLSLNFL